MAGTKVIIAGAGIAGPVLGMLLKLKGYEPTIYERLDAPTDAGLALTLQANGLKVLDLIPGLVAKIPAREITEIVNYTAFPGSERELLRLAPPSVLKEGTGHAFAGVRRPALIRTLVEEAQAHGVPVVFGHQLVGLEESESDSHPGEEAGVTVRFANGATDVASFVVGCDGLHSDTRRVLFGEDAVSFTGLARTGGISPFPVAFRAAGLSAPMFNIYGDGVYMIGYPVNEREISWGITQREPEAKETWRAMDEERQKEFRQGPCSKLPFGGGELVRTAGRIIKFGLYDRPELPTCHKGRAVLIGDAAHPTSPHLGQGANQALEDCYHLTRLLVAHNPSGAPPSPALLDAVFTEFEQLRIARTSALVKRARQHGELLAVSGADACRKRDEAIEAILAGGVRATAGAAEHSDSGSAGTGTGGGMRLVAAHYLDMLEHPFRAGESAI